MTLNSRTVNKSAEKKKEDSGPTKEEKFVTDSIIKIQAFFRMMICRNKYIDFQAKKAEEDLEKD